MKGFQIQVLIAVLSMSAIYLSITMIALASKPEVYTTTFRMGSFSDMHAEPRYDPNISNLKFCKEGPGT